MINPTGGAIRNDVKGQGHYGARRTGHTHQGTDYICTPGQPVVAPISGILRRKIQVYKSDKKYTGLEIVAPRATIKLFYCIPEPDLIGTWVEAGSVIATAQNISKKYSPEMIPHIHFEITHIDPAALVGI